MCKSPTVGVKVLLLAWEIPKGQEALKGNWPGSMSIEFTRELVKAYITAGNLVTSELCKVRDRIFWGTKHPCCVIDWKDIREKDVLVEKIDDLHPLYVLLLGSKVSRRVSPRELGNHGRIVLELGFPIGNNQKKNIGLIKQQYRLRQLLLPTLTREEPAG